MTMNYVSRRIIKGEQSNHFYFFQHTLIKNREEEEKKTHCRALHERSKVLLNIPGPALSKREESVGGPSHQSSAFRFVRTAGQAAQGPGGNEGRNEEGVEGG